jgi:Lysyl-tRNA synthetase (class II)
VSDDLNVVLKARREKLDALRSASIEPFAYSYERTHSAADALAITVSDSHENGPRVSVAGRLVAWRAHGKTAFAHLADSSGRIQLYFRKDQLGDERFAVLTQMDLGDFVGVAGPLFKTKPARRQSESKTSSCWRNR